MGKSEKGEERKKIFLLDSIRDFGSMSLLYREGESTYRMVITPGIWNPI